MFSESRRKRLHLYWFYIDLLKAYGTVSKNYVCRVLLSKRLRGNMLYVLRDMYGRTKMFM